MIEQQFAAIRQRIAELKNDRETAIVRHNDVMAEIYQGEMLDIYHRLLDLANSVWLDSGAAVHIDPAALEKKWLW